MSNHTTQTPENISDLLMSLRNAKPVILPSMLMCDFGNLENEMEKLESAGIEAIHLDVMDGNFVPNLTYGFPIVKAFRELTGMPIDVHLMISNPSKYAMQFAEAGADMITFHAEVMNTPESLLKELHDSGTAVGLAINPSTPVERLMPHLSHCSYALIMSVEAGFGGQSFNEEMLERTRLVRREMGPDFLIEMDGGINEKTIRSCVDAGADLLVVGSAIFGNPDYSDAIAQLRNKLPAGS